MSRRPVMAPPSEIPPGERVLWVGGPDTGGVARFALHWRKFAVYFVLLLAWRLMAVWRDAAGAEAAQSAAVTTMLLGACVLAALGLFARASARSTQYTITEERIVIRTGVALSIAINLPFQQIESADVRRRKDGGGDIELALVPGARAGYLILWPSAKPFHFAQPVPMLRALAAVDHVALLLGEALRQHAGAQDSAPEHDVGGAVVAQPGALTAH
ncbi:MAG: photosynthetic complex putative assembly protein PuhB [Pseudomonadota bacterium]